MNSLVIVKAFVEQINAHDVNALTALMTDDHLPVALRCVTGR